MESKAAPGALAVYKAEAGIAARRPDCDRLAAEVQILIARAGVGSVDDEYGVAWRGSVDARLYRGVLRGNQALRRLGGGTQPEQAAYAD